MAVSPDSLRGKFKEIHEALPGEERGVYLEALGSPSVPAERLAWSLEQLGHRVSPSLIRTFRRRLRQEREVHE